MSALVLDEQTPVARKSHRCNHCVRTIEIGEKYKRTRAITDDGPATWKTCTHCQTVYDRIWATDPDARYYEEGVDLLAYLQDYGPVRTYQQFQRKWRGVDAAELRKLSWATW